MYFENYRDYESNTFWNTVGKGTGAEKKAFSSDTRVCTRGPQICGDPHSQRGRWAQGTSCTSASRPVKLTSPGEGPHGDRPPFSSRWPSRHWAGSVGAAAVPVSELVDGVS